MRTNGKLGQLDNYENMSPQCPAGKYHDACAKPQVVHSLLPSISQTFSPSSLTEKEQKRSVMYLTRQASPCAGFGSTLRRSERCTSNLVNRVSLDSFRFVVWQLQRPSLKPTCQCWLPASPQTNIQLICTFVQSTDFSRLKQRGTALAHSNCCRTSSPHFCSLIPLFGVTSPERSESAN